MRSQALAGGTSSGYRVVGGSSAVDRDCADITLGQKPMTRMKAR